MISSILRTLRAFAFIFLLSVLVFGSVARAQITPKDSPSSHADFDQQLLTFSKQFDRTIILEDLPHAAVEPSSPKREPSTDFTTFLKQYDLDVIQAPGLLLLFKKPTADNIVQSITLEEASVFLEDMDKILSRFAPSKTKSLSEPVLYDGLDRHLYYIRQTQKNFAFALSPQAKIVAERSRGKTMCRLVAANTARSSIPTSGGANEAFACVSDPDHNFAYGQLIEMTERDTASGNPLAFKGTIRDVFMALGRADPERYQSLAVEDSIAKKPLLVYGKCEASAVRLCRGIATLYNLRVVEANNKVVLARHKPRLVANADDVTQELMRIVPASLVRLITDPPVKSDSYYNTVIASVPRQEQDRYYYKMLRRSDEINWGETTRSEAVKQLNDLLGQSLDTGRQQQGFSVLSDSPAIYNRLIANTLIADAISSVAYYLKKKPSAKDMGTRLLVE